MNSKELLNLLEEEPIDDGESSYLSPATSVVNLLDIANLVKSTLGDQVYESFSEYVTLGTLPDAVTRSQLKAFLAGRDDYVSQELLLGLGDK